MAYPSPPNYRARGQGSAWVKFRYPDRTVIVATQGRTFNVHLQDFLRRWFQAQNPTTFTDPDGAGRGGGLIAFAATDIATDGEFGPITASAVWSRAARILGLTQPAQLTASARADNITRWIDSLPASDRTVMSQARGEWRANRIGPRLLQLAWWALANEVAAGTRSVASQIGGLPITIPALNQIEVPTDGTPPPWSAPVPQDAPHFGEIVAFDVRTPPNFPDANLGGTPSTGTSTSAGDNLPATTTSTTSTLTTLATTTVLGVPAWGWAAVAGALLVGWYAYKPARRRSARRSHRRALPAPRRNPRRRRRARRAAGASRSRRRRH